MAKPITHELTSIWITADGKRFINEDDAKEHQTSIIKREKEEIKEEIKFLKKRLKEYEKNSNHTYEESVSIDYVE